MKDEKKTQWRTSKELHSWIVERAKRNGRSMNSEINRILKKAREEELQQAA